MTISARKTAPYRRIPSYYEFATHRVAPEDLLVAADRALYQAKRQGRDRVVQAPSLRALAAAA